MYILALGIYMVYTWYIPCIIFLRVPDDGNMAEWQYAVFRHTPFPYADSEHYAEYAI
jgi:hypothetical protein